MKLKGKEGGRHWGGGGGETQSKKPKICRVTNILLQFGRDGVETLSTRDNTT